MYRQVRRQHTRHSANNFRNQEAAAKHKMWLAEPKGKRKTVFLSSIRSYSGYVKVENVHSVDAVANG
jgi:hypothetical protein